MLDVARRCLPRVRDYHPAGFAELEGIATGAGLEVAQVWAMNALTDLRDILAFGSPELWRRPLEEGCSSFVVPKVRAQNGHGLCGQTWDLATDNMPYVLVVVRTPKDQPKTVCLTTVGCLSLIGLNAAGIAVGTTNIRTRDARIGVGYLDIIHSVLAATGLAEAERSVREAPRAGAHYYYLMDAKSDARAMECTADRAHTACVDQGSYTHCNHVLVPAHEALEVTVPRASSYCRQTRLESLLAGEAEVGVDDLKQFLSDHEDESRGICRHDFEGISSNGAVIMSPGERKLWVVHGPPCRGEWKELSVL